jgi:WD40 repeat protein
MESLVKIWDPVTGQEILVLRGHSGEVHGVVFSPDGRRLASAGYDRTVKVWDLDTGQVVRTLQGHTRQLLGVAFSPNGQYLASASQDKTVKVWNATSGEELKTLTGHTGATLSVAFSPDGRYLATASEDKTVKVWNASTGQEQRTLTGHTDMVYRAVFSPDGQRLASASDDKTVKVWDPSTGQEHRTLTGHSERVTCVVFSPDDQHLASASDDKTVKVWNLTTGQEVLTLRGHTLGLCSVAFSPDGQRLASGGEDETVKLWEATALTPELRLQREAASLVNRLAAEPLIKEEVSTRLRRDASLSDAVRKQALAMVERYREDPFRFQAANWAVVRQPGAEETRYRQALSQAEAAWRLASSHAPSFYGPRPYLNTLGAAQYRVGQYREALDSLKRAEALYSTQYKGGAYWNLAFLAMAHYRLGEKAESQTVLARLRETMKSPQLANNKEAQALMREAATLIEKPAPGGDK